MSLNEAWIFFQEWYKMARPFTKVPEKKILETYLSNKWGKKEIKTNKWSGWRKRTQEDDVDEGLVIVASEDDLEPCEEKDGESVITLYK
jgi:hypothetical protein